ncbi:MAG: hypothetical protein E7388_04930 [Ruminococcaceae bacterium]|nr:hypothetical protein [Oscillospiraceae bacterium]
MIGYLCATPFHITAAITMQSGMFAGKKSTLIVMDHFDVDMELINRIKETGVFDSVLLFHSNNKTKLNKIKRLVNVFAPSELIKNIANKTKYTHFVCFALDFLNLAYIMKRYEKRGINCEFSFGDDGIGTYIREGIYKPKDTVVKLMKISGRSGYTDKITRLYTYKPDFMVTNRSYDILPIEQSESACVKRRNAVLNIWPLNQDIDIDGKILYFEQPNEADKDNEDQGIEQQALSMAAEMLDSHTVVKMHPRSTAESVWQKFGVLKTKMPYEVMLLQKQCAPKLMMTVNSTALFSTYLFDDLPAATCASVLLYKIMIHKNETLNSAMSKLCDVVNKSQENVKIYNPETMDELRGILQ